MEIELGDQIEDLISHNLFVLCGVEIVSQGHFVPRHLTPEIEQRMAYFARIELYRANNEILCRPPVARKIEVARFVGEDKYAGHEMNRTPSNGYVKQPSAEKGGDEKIIPFDDALRRLVNTPPKPKRRSSADGAPEAAKPTKAKRSKPR